jgi:hypothetical protein
VANIWKPGSKHRINLGQVAFVRSKAILEIAAERQGYPNFGRLLDDYADALAASLKLDALDVANRIQSILQRQGSGRPRKKS